MVLIGVYAVIVHVNFAPLSFLGTDVRAGVAVVFFSGRRHHQARRISSIGQWRLRAGLGWLRSLGLIWPPMFLANFSVPFEIEVLVRRARGGGAKCKVVVVVCAVVLLCCLPSECCVPGKHASECSVVIFVNSRGRRGRNMVSCSLKRSEETSGRLFSLASHHVPRRRCVFM